MILCSYTLHLSVQFLHFSINKWNDLALWLHGLHHMCVFTLDVLCSTAQSFIEFALPCVYLYSAQHTHSANDRESTGQCSPLSVYLIIDIILLQPTIYHVAFIGSILKVVLLVSHICIILTFSQFYVTQLNLYVIIIKCIPCSCNTCSLFYVPILNELTVGHEVCQLRLQFKFFCLTESWNSHSSLRRHSRSRWAQTDSEEKQQGH